MSGPVLKVAVVGHTNTGKTSLLRTLTHDVDFGEVSDRPATTRHVEGAVLLVEGRPAIELYDTPGLEDSIGLRDHLDALCGAGQRRVDNIEIVQRFLAGPEAAAGGRFAQEAKAIRQVMASDVALYVVDARDRVLGKHRDELDILGRCARPVVPVLNFVASPGAQTALWREHMARVNMHAVAEFDTVVRDEQSERRLLEKMRTLLDRHHAALDAVIEERQQQRARLILASADLVADLLIDAAAHVVSVPADDQRRRATEIEALQSRVRQREQSCVEQLLALHRFRAADYQGEGMPITDGRWGLDLFSPAAMKQFGVRTGGGAAAGAMVGLTIDAMVGGASLGAAAGLGAAIGALLGAGQTHGRRLIDQMRGFAELRINDATVRLLLARQVSLVLALLRRGHASMQPIRPEGERHHAGAHSPPREVVALVDAVKLKPRWSRLDALSNPRDISGPARRAAQDRLTAAVEKVIQHALANSAAAPAKRPTR